MEAIDPGCCLEENAHEQEWAFHEVMEGAFLLGAMNRPCHQGRMAVISKGEPHGVKAGEDALVTLAKSFPALVSIWRLLREICLRRPGGLLN